MKNRILVMMLQVLLSGVVFGQTVPPDNQWVIKGGEGINMTGSAFNYDPFDNLPFLKFDNFKYPSGSQSRNDVFIIYNDGSFFNSYTLADTDWNDNYGTGSGYYINNLSTSPEGPIQYLYWTNRYEGDDLDEKVTRVSSGGNFTLPVSVNNDVSYFNVNHDIVPNTDVTLIIKKPEKNCIYYLEYNVCDFGSCSDLLTENFSVFANSTGIDVNHTTTTIPNRIQLAFNNQNIAYVNFRVNGTALQYAQQEQKAKFKLITEGEVGCRSELHNATILVPINAAHDPNYMQLNSICKNENNEILLNYYVQVQNTEETAGTYKVKIELPIPPCVNLNDIHIQEVRFNSETKAIPGYFNQGFSCEKSGNILTFHFPENDYLKPFDTNDINSSIASVKFCVKLNELCSDNYTDFTTPLLPETGTSYFDILDFPIAEFIDLPSSIKDSVETGSRPVVFNNCDCIINDENKCPCFCNSFSPICCGKINYPFWALITAVIILTLIVVRRFLRNP